MATLHPVPEVMAATGGDVDDPGDDHGYQVSRFAHRKDDFLEIVTEIPLTLGVFHCAHTCSSHSRAFVSRISVCTRWSSLSWYDGGE